MNGFATFIAGGLFGAAACALGAWRIALRRRVALSGPLHELRGALAAIQLGIFTLERRASGSLLADRVDALRTQTERAHLAVEEIDDVRLARRAAAGRFELADAGALVRRRVAAWSGLAESRRRLVELRWPVGPALVRADGARVGQALDNLIVNALDHGGGIVRVSGTVTDSTVRIAVADQGGGIGRPLGDAMRAPWHARHGHGLAVAARIAELHGGRLTARSGAIGSRVEMELPLAEPLTAPAAAPSPLTRTGAVAASASSGGR